MSDLLHDIAGALKAEYQMKPSRSGKHLQKGVCPSCSEKSLWTYAASPWVVRCERSNNCGWEGHAKDLFPDFFESWTDRYQKPEAAKPEAERNPHAAADAYLQISRGFDLARVRGLYTQESYFDPDANNGQGAGSATVRFQVASTFWERIIDKPWRFGKKKANFKAGGTYAGYWWSLPSLSFVDLGAQTPADAPEPPTELWLVEGIFDAIALAHHGIAAVALLSCNNYPEHALAELRAQLQRQGETIPEPTLVWALDSDKAGRSFTVAHVRRAGEDGWACEAAQIPQPRGVKGKLDWNDLHQRERLGENDLKEYRHHGALLIAKTAEDKALLIYNHGGRATFDFEHDARLFWFKLDLERFNKAREDTTKAIAEGHLKPMDDDAIRDKALAESRTLQPIANCAPHALYYQRNEITQEAWYYFRVAFPAGHEVRGTFTAGHLSTASEFKKQLLHMAAGAMFSGNSAQLERMMLRQLDNIKVVQTVDFVGYSAQHKTYLLGAKVAVRGGQVHESNAEDYFEFDKLSIKTLQRSIPLAINTKREGQDRSWTKHLWTAFGAKGYVALAFWFGSLFAEQIRETQKSFPFLEIVGEPGAGKSTLIQFLWKLFGRDHEGFDPAKSTSAGRLRTFTQVAGLPIVLIESDRETKSGDKAHVRSFDWDELKDAYNGNPVRTTGVKTGGNETYDPPFRASFVISQNNPVAASQAIMERICHMTFSTAGHNAASLESTKALERVQIEAVSGFILSALRREVEIVKTIDDETEANTRFLLAQDGIHKPRIAKNHAQLLATVAALRMVMPMPDEQIEQVRAQIVTMARERQQAINADHPLVQEFWESFDFLDSLGTSTPTGVVWHPTLNHSRDSALIAVNLNEYVEMAAQRRQQIPLLTDLKRVLRTSKTRRFVDVKPVNSVIRSRLKTRNDQALGDAQEASQSVYCWVFERPGAAARRNP